MTEEERSTTSRGRNLRLAMACIESPEGSADTADTSRHQATGLSIPVENSPVVPVENSPPWLSRDGMLISTTNKTRFTDRSVLPDTNYLYSIVANDGTVRLIAKYRVVKSMS
jgi:hypothetical protein